jgi:hypothetical protein
MLLNNQVVIRVQTGHLQVKPDQILLLLRHLIIHKVVI